MKRLAAIGVGLGLVSLLIIGICVRSGRTAPTPQPRKSGARAPVQSGYYAPPKNPGPPAPAEEISKATEEARVKSTYLNYRTAVATGNARIQASLHKVLLRHRDLALKYAQDDLANARESRDQEIAQRTMEALRK